MMPRIEPLRILDRSAVCQKFFGGGADPKWITSIKEGELPKPEPRIAFSIPDQTDDLGHLKGYQIEVIRRLHWWAGFYMDRAETREIGSSAPCRGQGALGDLIEVIDGLAEAIDSDTAAIDAARLAAYAAIDAAKDAANIDAARSGKYGSNESNQATELNESPMQSLLLGFDCIEELRRQALRGDISTSEARTLAAEQFISGWISRAAFEDIQWQ